MKPADQKFSASTIIAALGIIAAIIVAAGLLYRLQGTDEVDLEAIAPTPEVIELVIEEPQVPEAEIPTPAVVEAPSSAQQPTPEPIKLPDLDDSDGFVRERMQQVSEDAHFARWLTADDLLRRSASYLDGLSRGVVLSKIFPLSAPQDKFTTHKDGQTIWLNAGNYERYDDTIDALMSLDTVAAAKMFHLARPLLEASFSEMGYNPRQMEGIILQAIDRVLATPIIVEPIELIHESVFYEFADPELEALLPVQKQVLRTGPENTQKLQQQALALKTALLNP